MQCVIIEALGLTSGFIRVIKLVNNLLYIHYVTHTCDTIKKFRQLESSGQSNSSSLISDKCIS